MKPLPTVTGAEEILRMPSPDGGKLWHAELKIGNSRIYPSDDFPESGNPPRSPKALGGTPFNIHQYTKDTDAAIQRAADAGAKVIFPATEMFWGDRYGKVQEPFGHDWGFATHISDPTPEEMARTAEEMFSGAPQG